MATPTERLPPSRLRMQQLLLMRALDEHGSVLRAAQALNITQPAASKLLHQLETTAGVALFSRHARGVVATPYGEILVRHARIVLAELRQAGEELDALRTGLAGHVAIGTEATAATTLVPRAVAWLKQRFPRVTVSIEHAFSETLVALVQAGKLDIAVARVPAVQDRVELHYVALKPAPHVMAVRAGHPLLDRRRLSWRGLASQTWVVPPPGNVMRSCLTLMFLEQNLLFPTQLVETASLPVIVSLLTMSDMMAPLPEQVVMRFREADVLGILPIPLDLPLGPAGIVTRRDETLSPAAQALLRAMLHETADFAGAR